MREKKTQIILMRTPNQPPLTSPLVINATGQRYRQPVPFRYLGGIINEATDIMSEIKLRVRLAWAFSDWLNLALYNTETAASTLKVDMLNAEARGTLRYGCVT